MTRRSENVFFFLPQSNLQPTMSIWLAVAPKHLVHSLCPTHNISGFMQRVARSLIYQVLQSTLTKHIETWRCCRSLRMMAHQHKCWMLHYDV